MNNAVIPTQSKFAQTVSLPCKFYRKRLHRDTPQIHEVYPFPFYFSRFFHDSRTDRKRRHRNTLAFLDPEMNYGSLACVHLIPFYKIIFELVKIDPSTCFTLHSHCLKRSHKYRLIAHSCTNRLKYRQMLHLFAKDSMVNVWNSTPIIADVV